jgi:hypothetical protein
VESALNLCHVANAGAAKARARERRGITRAAQAFGPMSSRRHRQARKHGETAPVRRSRSLSCARGGAPQENAMGIIAIIITGRCGVSPQKG